MLHFDRIIIHKLHNIDKPKIAPKPYNGYNNHHKEINPLEVFCRVRPTGHENEPKCIIPQPGGKTVKVNIK